MTSAPYWLIPTPWPQPSVSKVKTPSSSFQLTAALRRLSALRRALPERTTPPAYRLSTRPDSV